MQKLSWLLLVLLLLLPAFGTGGTVEASEPTYIQVPTAQWQILRAQTNQLEVNLEIAESILKEQKNTSTELLTQLSEAKKQLALTREELNSSKNSLAKAESSLKRTNELCEILKQSIAKEQKTSKRRAMQRTGYIITTLIAILVRT
ncbi:hypothetical protein [Phascolarctobacterium succinatutens]|uniref:hypothetical protein n=1 Tax=Phascolarctobacterium succinatutens TaxID=626940 RepID=UPI0026EADC79|nr:hypothetical protein [Phascolarctobacterium succinatutens]